jgi:hypothetical protein
MSKKEEESVFFVGIKDPIEIRRSILESSKEVVQYMQRAERFKEIRKEKTGEILKLKGLVEDTQKLVRKLKTELPKTKLRAASLKRVLEDERKEEIVEKRRRAIKKAAAEKKKHPHRHAKKAAKVEEEAGAPPIEVVRERPKPMSDLEKLEAELGEIESRLSKIS